MMSQTTPREFPRRYLPESAQFCSWDRIEPFYRELAERTLADRPAVERWLADFSEVEAAFAEENTQRYTDMTCQTDDPQRQAAFLEFVEHLKPAHERWVHRLHDKLLAAAAAVELPARRYDVLLRAVRAAVALYCDENVALHAEDEKLQTEYQTIVGALTCKFRGQERTIQQVSLFLEEPERATREEAWRAVAERYAVRRSALDQLYVQMVNVRQRMARNANCDNFRDYQFRALQRFDYTAGDCFEFHRSIERIVVPAARQILARRQARLGVDVLRPWDLEVDADGAAALRPFASSAELRAGCRTAFAQVHSEFAEIFDVLHEQNMLDLESRKGKAPGGYQATFPERRLPFIFMNAVGADDDVRTLLHEGGHAFHTWACRQEPILAYRDAPTEFSEVASMGMELLALPYTDHFYNGAAPRARRQFFEKIVLFFPFMACVDAFQHYVYTHAEAGVDAWSRHWVELAERFSVGVDWSGLDDHRRSSWHRKLHIFEVPFYYVEYGIAQLGALQVWMNSLRDPRDAIARYRQSLALGGSRPLPELFAAAGCRFDFSEATLAPLIERVMDELATLP